MIKIANAPCSWGALEFDLEGEVPGYVQVLNEIAGTGYAGTELGDWGFMPTEPKKLAQEIHARNLVLLGAFVPIFLKEPSEHAVGVETAVRIARLMAAVEGSVPVIVLADENGRVPERTQNAGRVTPDMGLSDAEWQNFAEGATKVAEAVKKETGLRTAFHHHCAGYVETSGRDRPTHVADRPERARLDLRLRSLSLWRRRSARRLAQIRQTSLALSFQGLSSWRGKGSCGQELGLLSVRQAGRFL